MNLSNHLIIIVFKVGIGNLYEAEVRLQILQNCISSNIPNKIRDIVTI